MPASVAPGTKLGPYEVTAKLGEGGMGQVFRARDSRLGREVAIKVIADAFVADADRLSRLMREAQTLAALNHPNIAQIHGLEDSSAGRALVMELVEGDDLSARLAHGPLALEDALPIARQIADALEAAHDSGVVHRDLKPANVKVRADGTVKVLDFGLAKALDPARPGAANTMTSPAVTQQGIILGTAGYMSPEQAKGRPVDKRADIWAFGAVLFEMLSGERLFGGETVTETIAAVLKDDPRLDRLPPHTPSSVRRLIERCLERDPRRRLRDIGEARITLSQGAAEPALPVQPAAPARSASPPLTWLAGALLLAAGAAVVGWYWGSRGEVADRTPPFEADIVPQPSNAFTGRSTMRAFVFTPDGRSLIYASAEPGARKLYRRDRETSLAVPIAGTEGGFGPFLSPDGAAIGFFADGKMKRVPIGGGATQIIRDLRAPDAPDAQAVGWAAEVGPGRELAYGAAWMTDDTIVYSRMIGGLWRVPATGGTPTQVTTVTDASELAHRLPHVIPDDRTVLFTTIRTQLATVGSTVEAIDLSTGRRRKLMDDATDGRYANGLLLFARQGALYSVRFDPASLDTSGEPTRVIENVMHAIGGGGPGGASGVAQFDVSIDGVLAWLEGGVIPSRRSQLAWIGPGERIETLGLSIDSYLAPALSPDGTRVAVSTSQGLTVVELADGIATPLSKDAIFPVWARDGSRLYVAVRSATGSQSIHSKTLDGRSTPLVEGKYPLWPSAVSTDGRWLLYVETNPTTGNDIWAVALEADATPRVIANTPANETHPTFSPDGRWLLHVVDDGASSEIYVRPFPGPGRADRLTRNGGRNPRWLPGGDAIVYDGGVPGPAVSQMMRASVERSGDRLRLGPPSVFATAALGFATPVGGYDLARDGSRLLGAVWESTAAPVTTNPTLRIVVNANLAGAK